MPGIEESPSKAPTEGHQEDQPRVFFPIGHVALTPTIRIAPASSFDPNVATYTQTDYMQPQPLHPTIHQLPFMQSHSVYLTTNQVAAYMQPQYQYSSPHIYPQTSPMTPDPSNQNALIPYRPNSELDYGPSPRCRRCICLRLLKSFFMCFFREDNLVKKHLAISNSNDSLLVARSSVHYIQFVYKGQVLLPRCYPYTAWTLDPKPRRLTGTSCSYEEMEEYVRTANKLHEKQRKKINALHTVIFVIRILLSIVLAIGGIISGILEMRVPCGILLFFVGVVLFVGSEIQACIIHSQAKKLWKSLAEHIDQTKTPLLEKGVNVRPGYYGAYLIFLPDQ